MLHRRWFYVALGLIVVAAYARLFLGRPPAPAATSAPQLETELSMREQQEGFEAALRAPRVVETLNAHPGLMVALSCWIAAALLLFSGGIVLNLRAASIRRLRRIFQYRAPISRAWSLGDVSRIALLLLLVASLLPFVRIALGAWELLPISDQHLWSLLAMAVLHVWVVLIAWGFAAAKSIPLARALGLPVAASPSAGGTSSAARKVPPRSPTARGWSWRGIRRAVGVGLTGYVALVPWILALLWLIMRVCQQLGIQPPMEPVQEMLFLESRPGLVAATVVLACVVGPVVEEILFRGILFSAVRTHTSRLVAMLISGGIFSALHTNLVGFLPILVLGCLLADLYDRTGSLLSCISVHIVHNIFLMSFGLILKAMAS